VDVGNVFSTGRSPQFYGPPSDYYTTGATQAQLSDPSVLPKVGYGFAFSRLRESVGVSVQWLAPLGLFRFSLAVPLNSQRFNADPTKGPVTWGDQTERFQFSVGQAF